MVSTASATPASSTVQSSPVITSMVQSSTTSMRGTRNPNVSLLTELLHITMARNSEVNVLVGGTWGSQIFANDIYADGQKIHVR